MKTLIALLALAVLGLLWLRHENQTLARSFEKANHVAAAQKRTIVMLENQRIVAQRLAGENERAQVSLREKLNAAGERATRREQAITRLLNENESLRRWYGAELPDAVRRLHYRAPCASAGDCIGRLPESESLPDARQRSEN